MHAAPILLASLALGAGLAIGAQSPASATSSSDVDVTRISAEATPVTGEPWSAPAYPVDCRAAANQVTCTPTNPSEVDAQTCYLWVLYEGENATVCTTYEGHADAIKVAGGSPALVEYGCSIGDVACITFENAGRGMAMGRRR